MNLKVSDAKREEGFTLIELLVVVIIIGILAAIAIPVFLNQRERAWIRTAESDARNAAIEVETFFNDNFTYPEGITGDHTGIPDGAVFNDTFTATGLADSGDVVVSPNVVLTYDFADTSYCITANHDLVELEAGEDLAVYDSATGGISQDQTCSLP